MLTITALARRFGLARSTLLHYDHLGLLEATERSLAGYRRYGPGAVQRLEAICTYRRAGLSLQAIGRILDGPPHRLAQVLEARLEELDREMGALREQQAVLAGLLERPELLSADAPLDKATWTELLRASGMSDEAMDRWHRTFEIHAPERHQRFLEVLGLSRAEAARLRRLFGAPAAANPE
jgi:DNA-binding transcriptional MerR regulator